MKKLLLLILITIWTFSINAQHLVRTNNGGIYRGKIRVNQTDNIQIKTIKGKLYSLSIADVDSIAGKLTNYSKTKLIQKNANIKFSGAGFNQYTPEDTSVNSNYVEKTPGFSVQDQYYSKAGSLIRKSASLRLTGFLIPTAATTLYLGGAFDELDQETKNVILIGSSIIGAILYIGGEINQMRAGELMLQENIVLKPTETGIGLALKF